MLNEWLLVVPVTLIPAFGVSAYLSGLLDDPKYIEVWGKFTPRGGISIDPYCNYGRPGTRWEEVAWQRLANHDLYPEKVDNR